MGVGGRYELETRLAAPAPGQLRGGERLVIHVDTAWPDGATGMAAYTSVVETPAHDVPHYGEPVFHDDGSVTVEGTTYERVPARYRMVEVGRVERPE